MHKRLMIGTDTGSQLPATLLHVYCLHIIGLQVARPHAADDVHANVMGDSNHTFLLWC